MNKSEKKKQKTATTAVVAAAAGQKKVTCNSWGRHNSDEIYFFAVQEILYLTYSLACISYGSYRKKDYGMSLFSVYLNRVVIHICLRYTKSFHWVILKFTKQKSHIHTPHAYKRITEVAAAAAAHPLKALALLLAAILPTRSKNKCHCMAAL